jgi:hypothetical protein
VVEAEFDEYSGFRRGARSRNPGVERGASGDVMGIARVLNISNLTI